MGKKREALIISLFIILTLIFINLASASFQLGTPGYSVESQYEQGDKISGWINISFSNQSYDDMLIDSFGNSATLQSLLDKDSSYVVNITNASVNSSIQILSLNDTFLIPNILGNLSFQLNFSGQNLISENITLNSGENISLKLSASKKIIEKETDLDNFKKEIETYQGFIQKRINNSFNITLINQKIQNIKTNYTNAQNNDDYQDVIDAIENIKIPKSLVTSKSADNLPFIPTKNSINLNILASISGSSYSPEDENYYLEGIYLWSQENLDVMITFKEISANYGLTEETLFSYFEISFNKQVPDEAYFVLQDIQNLEFEENYMQQKQGNYYYIPMSSFSGTRISFITSENVNFVNVPLFIAPSLEKLPEIGNFEYTEGGTQMSVSKWIFFGLIVLLLLVIAGVVYSIIQAWYDRKYENYLFPNKNNLYNLIIYINNSKKRGMKEDEISENLKKSKWTSEQIRYVMRKYLGKRTGLPKIFKKNKQENKNFPPHTIHPNVSQ